MNTIFKVIGLSIRNYDPWDTLVDMEYSFIWYIVWEDEDYLIGVELINTDD